MRMSVVNVRKMCMLVFEFCMLVVMCVRLNAIPFKASRFSNSDAVEPLVDSNPNISATGPSIPPKKIAPSSQGHSPLGRPDGLTP